MEIWAMIEDRSEPDTVETDAFRMLYTCTSRATRVETMSVDPALQLPQDRPLGQKKVTTSHRHPVPVTLLVVQQRGQHTWLYTGRSLTTTS